MYELFEQKYKECEKSLFLVAIGYLHNTEDSREVADALGGVLYRIIEFDSIELFADRSIYMAVLSEMFINNKAYSYDEKKTGAIAPREDYGGTNLLIKLKLDKSKAGPARATEYPEKLNRAE